MSPRKKFRNDIFLIAVILVVSVVLFAVFSILGTQGSFAVVIIDGKETERHSLSQNISVDISTDDEHINRLAIKDGSAKIEFANCPDKICSNHRAINKVGETIVCLPHKVVIKIEEKTSKIS